MDAQKLPVFATELRIQITKHLHTDIPSLKTLSRAARQWLAPAQMLLFEVLHVTINKTRSMESLLGLIHASPHLGSYIHRLRLSDKAGWKEPDASLKIGDILALVALLPNMRALELHLCTIIASLHADSGPRPVLSHPCKLSLSRTRIDERALHDLVGNLTITQFSAIVAVVEVSGEATTFDPRSFAAASTIDLGWRVYYDSERGRMLSSEPPEDEPLINNILSVSPSAMDSVGVSCSLKDYRRVDALCDFLETKGHHIEHLRMDYGHATMIEMEAGDIDLPTDHTGTDGFGRMLPGCARTVNLSECCPRLKTLMFVLLVDRESGDDSKKSEAIVEWRYATRLLASAPRTLSSITFGLIVDNNVRYEPMEDCTIEYVQWKQVDSILQEFKALERIDFVRMNEKHAALSHFFEPYEPRRPLPKRWTEDLESLLDERMPQASARELLHIS